MTGGHDWSQWSHDMTGGQDWSHCNHCAQDGMGSMQVWCAVQVVRKAEGGVGAGVVRNAVQAGSALHAAWHVLWRARVSPRGVSSWVPHVLSSVSHRTQHATRHVKGHQQLPQDGARGITSSK